ncbi:MAG: hypothetical protein ABJB34_12220 [Acidobacteriota bacterium]
MSTNGSSGSASMDGVGTHEVVVEAVNWRVIFLNSGRLNAFGVYDTVRPEHITPIFKWKLEMMLAEAGFENVEECFNRVVYATRTDLNGKIAAVAVLMLSPFSKARRAVRAGSSSLN